MELVEVFMALFESCILLHDWHSDIGFEHVCGNHV